MHTSPANQSNNANIKPPNEPAPKQQNFECTEDTFKNLEIPVQVDISRYSFKRLETLKNSCVNFFNKVFNVNSEAASKIEGVQHLHFVKNAKNQLLLFIDTKDGVTQIEIAEFKSNNIKQAKSENRQFAIFNHVDKKVFLPESLRGINLVNAIVSASNPNHHQHLNNLQKDLANHEVIHISDDEWSEMLTYLEEHLPAIENEKKNEKSEKTNNNRTTQELHANATPVNSSKLNKKEDSSEFKRDRSASNIKQEFLKQDLDIENDRKRRNREKTLENARIKVEDDIGKQNKRTETNKEDIKTRDNNLMKKKEPTNLQ